MVFSFFVKNKMMALASLCFCMLMVAMPQASAEAARQAIRIWMQAIVPTMFPFLMLANFARNKGIAEALPASVYPVFMAVMSGYPMGAKIVADSFRNGEIGQSMLLSTLSYSMVTGPAFIIGSIGTGMYGAEVAGYILAFSHYLSAAICGILWRRKGESLHDYNAKRPKRRQETDLPFTDCILESFRTIGTILAYMILFMIGSTLLQHFDLFAKDVPWMRAFLCGVLELTSGCSQMSLWDGNLTLRLTLTSWMLSFGGLSVIGQTMSMLSGTSVTMAQVLKLKLIHGTFSAILTFIICAFVV